MTFVNGTVCGYLFNQLRRESIQIKWMNLSCHFPNVWRGLIKGGGGGGGGALQLIRQMSFCGRGANLTINTYMLIQILDLLE